MKLAVVGSRTFTDETLLFYRLDELLRLHEVLMIISGGACGADAFAERWAHSHKMKTKIFIPEWEKYGKQAGFLRNTPIVENCDQLLAFWDGRSKGTLDSITKAIQMKKFVMIQGF